MKHRISAVLVLLALVLLLASCGGKAPSTGVTPPTEPVISGAGEAGQGAEIALVALQDKNSSEQLATEVTWDILSRFAGKQGYTSYPYKTEPDEQIFLATIELAAKGGAKLIALQGDRLLPFARKAQMRHPTIQFLMLSNCHPLPEEDLRPNGTVISYAAEQGGWLAGYAAVVEGHRTMAYLQTSYTFSQRYAAGFLLGAEAAARDGELPDGVIEMHPYNGSDYGDDSLPPAQMGDLFRGDISVVFCNYQPIQEAVLAAAKAANKSMIGINLALESAGEAALTSLETKPTVVLQTVLKNWHQGQLSKGEVLEGTVATGDVALALEHSRLKKLTPLAYSDLVNRFAVGELGQTLAERITPQNDVNVLSMPSSLKLDKVTIMQMKYAGDSSAA